MNKQLEPNIINTTQLLIGIISIIFGIIIFCNI